jgi:hypothetical protein
LPAFDPVNYISFLFFSADKLRVKSGKTMVAYVVEGHSKFLHKGIKAKR